MAKGDDVSQIKSAIEELEQAAQMMSKALYEKGAAQPGAAGAAAEEPKPEAPPSDEEPIDAEFEVKDS